YGLAARHGSGFPALEPAQWIRARREAPARRALRRPEREPSARPGLEHAPAVAPPFPGEIAVPPEGAHVGGLVAVSGRPARTGWGVGRVALELSKDGERWREVAHHAGEAFDVIAVGDAFREHLAVVRSRRVAELLTLELARGGAPGRRFEIEPSQRWPWD